MYVQNLFRKKAAHAKWNSIFSSNSIWEGNEIILLCLRFYFSCVMFCFKVFYVLFTSVVFLITLGVISGVGMVYYIMLRAPSVMNLA